MFPQEYILKLINDHNREGRAPWKYKPITEKQLKIIRGHVPEKQLNKLDRGAARLVIEKIFEQNIDVCAWQKSHIRDSMI